jgi:hypothetical protein
MLLATDVARSTHLPKNRHTQLLRTTSAASGRSATYVVRKAGKKELTATSNAYVNSTRLSVRAMLPCETSRRFAMNQKRSATASEVRMKSPVG